MRGGSSHRSRKSKKGPKSCQACRRSKQRCDIPNRGSVFPSQDPQPPHLACHRCNVLKLPCVIDVAAELLADSTASSSQTPAQTKADRKRKASPPFYQPPSARRPLARGSPGERVRTTSPFQTTQGGIFDPQYRNLVWSASKANVRPDYTPDFNTHPELDLSEQINVVEHYRPFNYLTRMCRRHPDFLASRASQKLNHRSLRNILAQHAQQIDWDEFNEKLQAYELFLPFIEKVGPDRYESGRSTDFWLATRILLAVSRTDMERLQIDLLGYVRHHATIILAYDAENIDSLEDVAALLTLALYEPLLLVESGEHMQWNGDRFLSTVISVAKIMGLDSIAMQMQYLEDEQNPSGLLRKAAIWYCIASTIAARVLCARLTGRYEVDCSSQELEDVERFCKQCLKMPHADRWASQSSLLLLFLARYRNLRGFSECTRQILASQDSLATASVAADALLTQSLDSFEENIVGSIHQLHELRRDLVLFEDSCDLYLEFIEYEAIQIFIECLNATQEHIILRLVISWNVPLSISKFYAMLYQDSAARLYFHRPGNRRMEKTKMAVDMLDSLLSRWSQGAGNNFSPIAPPPAFLCAWLLSNLRALCEILDRTIIGKCVPHDCLAQKDLFPCARLARSVAGIMSAYTSLRPQSLEAYYAKGHREIFHMAASIATRTSKAMFDWLASQRGHRAAVSSVRGGQSSFSGQTPSAYPARPMYMATRSTGSGIDAPISLAKHNYYSSAAAPSSSSSCSPSSTSSVSKLGPLFYYSEPHHGIPSHMYQHLNVPQKKISPAPLVDFNTSTSLQLSDMQSFATLLEDILSTPIV